ncbi:hypothetical protein CHGG_08029 [Chaetomium globosum CBS 148.51]|uniref:RRM domain-containing protein n=1 Tax=Chaetomium globosum (strain ATCC 6205 / CBS 148.51 / DSM 1962 / NBRC 6347 / NRRL 1970) TaxID=306901 RepID=Q2GVH5_CHAGB|nr:uncharacterized protein CHGG_08029 [Chaetomium globosum CBS 148.51]EAQ86776.1 hypothetical protein CHGG_08029 [Chaetomium globosum CBS 148.51]
MSGSKVYVGNLSWSTDDMSLRTAFEAYGLVVDSIVMKDRDTNRSRGFGFVTFSTTEEAEAAIAGLDQQENIRVNMANARPSGGGRAFGGGGYSGGGGGGYSQGGY